jgi:hypothetical protein
MLGAILCEVKETKYDNKYKASESAYFELKNRIEQYSSREVLLKSKDISDLLMLYKAASLYFNKFLYENRYHPLYIKEYDLVYSIVDLKSAEVIAAFFKSNKIKNDEFVFENNIAVVNDLYKNEVKYYNTLKKISLVKALKIPSLEAVKGIIQLPEFKEFSLTDGIHKSKSGQYMKTYEDVLADNVLMDVNNIKELGAELRLKERVKNNNRINDYVDCIGVGVDKLLDTLKIIIYIVNHNDHGNVTILNTLDAYLRTFEFHQKQVVKNWSYIDNKLKECRVIINKIRYTQNKRNNGRFEDINPACIMSRGLRDTELLFNNTSIAY